MVFLALSPAGLAEALALSGGVSPVWCCATALSEQQFAAMHLPNLTRFAYSLAPSADTSSRIADALATIEEHHPGERIWFEHAAAV